jgi:hypothetical protein
MTSTVDRDLAARICQLERRSQHHRVAFVITLVFGAVIGVAFSWTMPQAYAQAPGTDGILKVRGLIVVDERGIERVRIGAPLPDPIVEGKRGPRQGVVSGILIFDADGDERGSLVTNATGDAFMTLDAKKGQQTVFVANRNGGANLALWSGGNRNDNYVSLRAVPTPLIEIVQGGKRIFTAGGPDAFSK